MERFYLITNRAKDPDLTVTDQIRQYLEERGKTCLLCDNSEKGEKYHYTDPAKVPSDIDGILVLGGDGTLLQAAGDVVNIITGNIFLIQEDFSAIGVLNSCKHFGQR